MFSNGVLEGKHHTSLTSFTKAATDWCYICAPLLKDARREAAWLDQGFQFQCDYKINQPLISRNEASSHLAIKIHGGVGSYSQSFYAEPPSRLPIQNGVYSRRTIIPMAKSLQAAQKWISNCLDKHEECQKHIRTHTYPTRLLELENEKACLILSRRDEPSGHYAALSYCWGPKPSFIHLTADNLQEFQLGLPYSDLPIAFQEAICMIRGLGIRYLWIDALCIIQSGLGSSEDWQSECGRMQEIYSNCFINLSLEQASHPNQSCLGGYTFGTTLPFEADIATPLKDHGLSDTRTYALLSIRYFKQGLYAQPIRCRAWVMQERLLAPRVLSIGHGELFWGCQQLPHASESLPYGLALYPGGLQRAFSVGLGLLTQGIRQVPVREGFERIWDEWTWLKLLREYVGLELTYPQADRLAALSAIAARVGSVMNDTYLAGHFWKTLPQSLKWKAQTLRQRSLPHDHDERVPYRLAKSSNQMSDGNWVITPSWSWASMHGPLDMSEIVNHNCNVATAESYRLARVSGKETVGRVEHNILLTIRTWCRLHTWEAFQAGTKKAETRLRDTGDAICFEIDDVHDQIQEGSEYLLAGLRYKKGSAWGLLLREINIDGHKVLRDSGTLRQS